MLISLAIAYNLVQWSSIAWITVNVSTRWTIYSLQQWRRAINLVVGVHHYQMQHLTERSR